MKNPATILIIEEQALERNTLLKGLSTEGFNLIGAESGRVGIQYAIERSPDLIMCGIGLSELDGFEILKMLRQNPITAIIPLIFVTDKTTFSDLYKAMELGADGYLIKPCTVEKLIQTVMAQLEKQAFLHQYYKTQSALIGEKPTSRMAKPPLPPALLIDSLPLPLREAMYFIKANHHRPISLSDVAQAVGYSPAYLTSFMGQQTGKTVQQWIIQHRMVAACSLLLETNDSVEQIAETVGYHNVIHFFRHFRRFFGTTPQTWRRERRLNALNLSKTYEAYRK